MQCVRTGTDAFLQAFGDIGRPRFNLRHCNSHHHSTYDCGPASAFASMGRHTI